MKNLVLLTCLSAILIMIIPNYILPILSLFVNIKYEPGIYKYLWVIVSYVSITLTILMEGDLKEYNFDSASLLVLILFGLFRPSFNICGEIIYKTVIWILTLILLSAAILKRKRIPKTNWFWFLLGLAACLYIIPITFLETLQYGIYDSHELQTYGPVLSLIRAAIYNLSFVSPSEEFIFRGILWGLLRKRGWNENKIFWVQAILFWLMHISKLSSPITFFITLPIMIVITSSLVRYSKQAFPSIIVHTATNTIIPLLVHYF